VQHLRANGLTVTSVSSNRTIVDATGPVSAVETAFGVTIWDWHDTAQNRDFFGNDNQPVLPVSLASFVVGISGLNNHYRAEHYALASPHASAAGPIVGAYTPTDLKTAYDVVPLAARGYTGAGQALGLFELDSFNPTNISTYDAQYGLVTVPPASIPVDGGSVANGGEIEVELDIEVMHAIAPSAPITVWEGRNTDKGAIDTYNAMVTSDTTRSNSTSWGQCEPDTSAAIMTSLDNVFKQAAAQGQSFYAASGDTGAFDCLGNPTSTFTGLAVDNPASDPYVTGVGGTTLKLGTNSSYFAEWAWSDRTRTPQLGSGGGLSIMFSEPAWQTGPGVANSFSNAMRQVPDVSLDADPRTGYSVYATDKGTTGWFVVAGTSAAAPAWAAFTGLLNQFGATSDMPGLGFANPTLYRLGSTAPLYPPFHDITTGDNLYYPATAGWDDATGWGSFDAFNLARDLMGRRLPPGLVPGHPGVPDRTTPPPLPQSGPTNRSLVLAQTAQTTLTAQTAPPTQTALAASTSPSPARLATPLASLPSIQELIIRLMAVWLALLSS